MDFSHALVVDVFDGRQLVAVRHNKPGEGRWDDQCRDRRTAVNSEIIDAQISHGRERRDVERREPERAHRRRQSDGDWVGACHPRERE